MAETMRACAFLDKGGVGKTTAIAHLGVALAEKGHDVLLIDLAGKQGDLAKQFGLWGEIKAEEDDWPNISTVFADEWELISKKLDNAVEDLVWETGEGPDLIPAHEGLDTLDSELNNIEDTEDRYSRLNKFLDEFVDDKYDVVLIDLPGLTNNVTYNGIWATQHVIAPARPGPFESEQASALQADLKNFEETFDIDVELTLVLPNEVDTRTNLGQKYLDAFASEYPEAIGEHVPSSQDIQNAQEDGSTVFALEELSRTAERARDAYVQNAQTLATRLNGGTHE
ncbi:ParA family protein [Haladaptatus halobius]|uniref:ParA family protein n=1 Tax=Haladaptatus halobius TaxID=2884875 RepID=UPI001D0BADB7|nr:ParA family protein [Haladaptatus halobius]